MTDIQKPKTVYIDPTTIFPLPAKQRVNCSLCAEPIARWKRLPRAFHCSKCVLYSTPWGKENDGDIRKLVSETEALLGSPLRRDESGNLSVPFDADRIVSAVVYISKLQELSAMAKPAGPAS